MTHHDAISREDLELQKLADTKYPIEGILRRRCSTIAFADRPVEVEKLQQLFEAARWAPSSFNEQPWSFILATRKETPRDHERLASCLFGPNRNWAHRAPVLVLSVAKRHFDASGKVNNYAAHDVGLATGNLVVQATAIDLFVHLMGGFDAQGARKEFAISDTHDAVCVFAIGYFGNLESLSPDLQQRERARRHRRPFKDFVFSGHWGHPSEIVPD